jgi:hypothetical protein
MTQNLSSKTKKGKQMSATETKNTERQKRTTATPEIFGELFKETMCSYEKALKSAIQLQEETVNLWKDAFTKLCSSKEFRAKSSR